MVQSFQLTKQDYQPKTPIAGVKIVELKLFRDDGGYFFEMGRFNDHVFEHFPEFELKQLNLSEIDPGAVKAWHIHNNQDDIWLVPPSQRMLVCLRDIRDDSETKDTTMRFVMGGGKAQLVYIPKGVAHGAANLWDKPAMIFYLMNNQFSADPELSDEYRLPWDQFGAELWQQTKG